MGTTGGGVMKSSDGGLSWQAMTDRYFGGTIGAIAVAMLLNAKLRGKRLYRTLFYAPSVASSAVISMIFHYHYQWNKADEKERNRTALHEHLAYIAALRGRDRQEIEASCRTHLASARQTLLRSIG